MTPDIFSIYIRMSVRVKLKKKKNLGIIYSLKYLYLLYIIFCIVLYILYII